LVWPAYLAYRLYFPDLVAKGISNRHDFIIPHRFQNDFEKLAEPLRDGAMEVVVEIPKSGITIDQVLQAIDQVEEERAIALLAEINSTETKSPDHLFDLIKKHLSVGFDIEVFRIPLTDRLAMPVIQRGIKYVNVYKSQAELDPPTVKTIAKKILLQKEAEFNRIVEME
jgi:hypothetical protein